MKNNFDFKDLKTLNKETKFLCVRNFLNYYVKIIILIVLALLLLNLLLKQNKSIEFLQPIITNDNFYMSVFTLLGALVGGFCTIVGAKMSFNSDIKAKASLIRTDKIYTLLYDELIYNHNMLINCTMDDLLVHSKNDGRDDYDDRLVYSELGKICNDSRSLEIPKKFKKQIDSFYNSIEEFQTLLKSRIKLLKNSFMN
ncbi:hypothetical protein KQI18_09005 [Clostridioides mangenotii]|uniref:hypothetical protein n=1 Tax=Metaclostridioides mangenotii TaxID=1540 RepID=UPI001C118985|nr:hypothetical protein [Clostridioides mangenotii]MBU5307925.1 hypothetical protein [Clostridioides mangenotii]